MKNGHEMIMQNRRKMVITGVLHVEYFDADEILLETVEGFLCITGEKLFLRSFSIEEGQVLIDGTFSMFRYIDESSLPEKKTQNFFTRLFT